ncbi:hypothetical protein FRC20_004008 [Serendipita sp. 405]|nr:hypothetical protein FRC20_004008 [Serendipita sp. 405]
MVAWTILALALGGPSVVQAIGTPLGFGSSTTGGGSAPAATPTSNAQLASWLSDSTARTIVLTSIFDFTNYYGTASGKICKPWTCSPNPQVAIDQNSWCENYQPSAATGTASWYVSGTGYSYSLKVGSKKTLLGKGSSAGIKGIGLLIQNADNVIIQSECKNMNAMFLLTSRKTLTSRTLTHSSCGEVMPSPSLAPLMFGSITTT